MIALGPTSRPPTSPRVDWTLSRIETDYQWYEVDGIWNYEPITRRSRVANGTLDLAAGAPARLDLPVDWGRYELALAATDGRYIATSLGFDAGWDAAGAGSETPDLLDAQPRPRRLCPRRHRPRPRRRAATPASSSSRSWATG